MKKILTITLNPAFDLHYTSADFVCGEENYVTMTARDAGGKGINISRALSTNGIKNTAYVILGEENGADFEACLRADGINYIPLYTPGRIRENMTIHPESGTETRISLDNFAITPATVENLFDMLDSVVDENTVMSFSGRIPRGVDKDHIIDFLLRLKSRGAKLVVDTKSLLSNDLAKIRPWLIKPNKHEIFSCLNRRVTSIDDAATAAMSIVGAGISEQVMVTLGGEGAAWSDGEKTITQKAPKLEEILSTVGAGDSTIAGYLAAYTAHLSDTDTLRYAIAYGTAACMSPGTHPPKKGDVAALLKKMQESGL